MSRIIDVASFILSLYSNRLTPMSSLSLGNKSKWQGSDVDCKWERATNLIPISVKLLVTRMEFCWCTRSRLLRLNYLPKRPENIHKIFFFSWLTRGNTTSCRCYRCCCNNEILDISLDLLCQDSCANKNQILCTYRLLHMQPESLYTLPLAFGTTIYCISTFQTVFKPWLHSIN